MIDSAARLYDNGSYMESVQWGEKALAKAKKLRDEVGTMTAYYELGNAQFYAANFGKSISNYFAALKIAEKRKDKKMQNLSLNCIANVYYAQNDFKKANQYYRKSMAADPVNGPSMAKGNCMGYMAGIFYNQKQFDSAMIYYEKTILIYSQFHDSSGLAMMQQNLASVYGKLGRPVKAEKMLIESLELSKKLGDHSGIGYAYFSLGLFYLENKQAKKAVEPLLKSLDEFKMSNDYAYVANSNLALSNTFYELKDFKQSIDQYKRYVSYKDSTNNTELTKEITRKELSFEVEKKQLADSLKRAEAEKEMKIRNDEKVKRQSLYTYAGAAGFLLMLIIVIILFRNNRIKQKANHEIRIQKEIIEEKQKELLDSINYAKRIQTAILPSEKSIDKIMKNRKK